MKYGGLDEDGVEDTTTGAEARKGNQACAFKLWSKVFPRIHYCWIILICVCSTIWFTISPTVSFGLGFFVDKYVNGSDSLRSTVSMYFSAAFVLTSLASPFVGNALDRFGCKRVNMVLVSVNAVCLFSLTVVPSVHFLLPLFLLLQITQSGMLMSIFALVGQWFNEKRGRFCTCHTLSSKKSKFHCRASAIHNFIGSFTLLLPAVQNLLSTQFHLTWKEVIYLEVLFILVSGIVVILLTVQTPESVLFFTRMTRFDTFLLPRSGCSQMGNCPPISK